MKAASSQGAGALGLVGLLILASGCATSYGARGALGGYSEQKLTDDTYIVEFIANAYTTPGDVEVYLMRRCAELTLEKGLDYFLRLSGTSSVQSVSAGMLGVVSKPDFTATIRMGKGPAPAEGFDAHQLAKNLSARDLSSQDPGKVIIQVVPPGTPGAENCTLVGIFSIQCPAGPGRTDCLAKAAAARGGDTIFDDTSGRVLLCRRKLIVTGQ